MVLLRTEIAYFFGQQIQYISCRIACEKRQLDLAEKNCCIITITLVWLGKKNITKTHGNTQVSTLKWVKVLQKRKKKKQICNSKVFQYLTLF